MSIRMTCPNGHRLKIKDRWAGRKGHCPKCRAKMHVPELASVTDEEVVSLVSSDTPTLPKPIANDLSPHLRDHESDRVLDDENVLDDVDSVIGHPGSGRSLLGSSFIGRSG